MSKELGVKGLIRYRVAQEHEKYAHKSYAEKGYWIDAIVDKLSEELEALIAEREQRIRTEAFEQGQIMATESLDDGLIVLMASTSEKLEAAIEHHKKAGWVTSGAIRGNPHVLQQVMIKRLAELKGERS